jgi:hypothetical protein
MVKSRNDWQVLRAKVAGRRLVRQGLDLRSRVFTPVLMPLLEQLALGNPLPVRRRRCRPKKNDQRKKGEKGGRRPRSALTKAIIDFGLPDRGWLTPLLNDRIPGVSQHPRTTAQRLDRQGLPYFNDGALPKGIGQALRDAFDFGRWPSLQAAFLVLSGRKGFPLTDDQRAQVMVESLLYAQGSFDISRCEYGGHWFVRGDKRQKDCRFHNDKGRRVRFLENKKTREARAAG